MKYLLITIIMITGCIIEPEPVIQEPIIDNHVVK